VNRGFLCECVVFRLSASWLGWFGDGTELEYWTQGLGAGLGEPVAIPTASGGL
jgi:hypothetical protein